LIDTALISAPTRGSNRIFGRPLLERLMLICERAGLKRFFIETSPEQRTQVLAALGSFRGHTGVDLVDSFDHLLRHRVHPQAQCVVFMGNLVLSPSHLSRILTEHAQHPGQITKMVSADHDCGGIIAAGPMEAVLKGLHDPC
jgi:hypothetical protein